MERNIEKIAYTPEELRVAYGLEPGTLANLRCKKRGPKFFKIGRKCLYMRADVEAWIRRHPVLTADCPEVRS
ncbi:MAG: helix-turn-helix transcriptional regulator [Syntrophales bacterium]